MQKNQNWVNNLGNIWLTQRQDGSKNFFITLGDPKNQKQPLHVKLVFCDAQGNPVAESSLNPIVSVKDPREGATEEQKARLPEKLRYRLSLGPAKE